jgi:hypothetical protein
MEENNEQSFQTTSPTPPTEAKPVVTYLFFDALKEVLGGRKVTRLAWGNENIYVYMYQNILSIYGGETGDHEIHKLILHETDMVSDDWILLPEGQ